VEIKDVPVIRRCISLQLLVKGSKENVGTAVKCACSRQTNVRNVKGSCMVVAIMATVRATPTMVAQVRHVISVALKGIRRQVVLRSFPIKLRPGTRKRL